MNTAIDECGTFAPESGVGDADGVVGAGCSGIGEVRGADLVSEGNLRCRSCVGVFIAGAGGGGDDAVRKVWVGTLGVVAIVLIETVGELS